MIYRNVLEAVGQTPLIRLNRMPEPGSAEVLVKFEALNVGTTVGIAPDIAKKLRLFYSTIVSLIAFLLYLIAGIICFG